MSVPDKDLIKQKVEEKLERWAVWSERNAASGLGYPKQAPWMRLIKRSDKPGSNILIMPDDEDAMQIERDINNLKSHYRLALIVYWLHAGGIAEKVKHCKCSRPTFYNHLNRAYESLYNCWFY